MKRSIVAACFGWLFSAIDIVLLLIFQFDISKALHVAPAQIGLAIAAGSAGSAVGGILFTHIGDRYGRVRALGWSVVLYSAATAGMALSPNLSILVAMRFLSGIGTGGEWSLGFALVAEVAARRGRGALGGLVAAMFNVGTFAAIVMFQAHLDWRTAFGLMVLPSLGVIVLRRTVPESPVWLDLQEMRKRGEVEPELEAAYQRPPIALLFQGRLLRQTLLLTLVFALMNFAFFGFSTEFQRYLQEPASTGALGLSRGAQAPFQLSLNLASLISAVLAGVTSDKVGRRLSYTLFCALGAVASVALYQITSRASGTVPSGLPLVFAAVVTAYGINGVIGTIASEIFPTHLRATGPGFTQNVGKGLGGSLGPMLVGPLIARVGYPLALSLPGTMLVLLGVLIWSLPAVGGREVKPVEDDSYLETKPS